MGQMGFSIPATVKDGARLAELRRSFTSERIAALAARFFFLFDAGRWSPRTLDGLRVLVLRHSVARQVVEVLRSQLLVLGRPTGAGVDGGRHEGLRKRAVTLEVARALRLELETLWSFIAFTGFARPRRRGQAGEDQLGTDRFVTRWAVHLLPGASHTSHGANDASHGANNERETNDERTRVNCGSNLM